MSHILGIRIPGQAGHFDPREPGPMPRHGSTVASAPSSPVMLINQRLICSNRISAYRTAWTPDRPRLFAPVVRGYEKTGGRRWGVGRRLCSRKSDDEVVCSASNTELDFPASCSLHPTPRRSRPIGPILRSKSTMRPPQSDGPFPRGGLGRGLLVPMKPYAIV